MKILKNGRVISNTQVVKCWKCKAKLEIEANDLFDGSDCTVPEEGEHRFAGHPVYAFECPCCHRINEVKKLNENLEFALRITE